MITEREVHAAAPLIWRDVPLECGAGWNAILLALGMRLDAIRRALATVNTVEAGSFFVTQCKEKFGRLTVYLTAYPMGADDEIRDAVAQSGLTCEQCGELGMLRRSPGNWLYTACDAHVLRHRT